MAITIDGTNGLSSDNAALKLDGTTLAVDETNNRVGVGTASPAVAMDVVGQVRASTGILFGSDTAAANALDDYEEGTWTPTLFNATTTTYTTQSATYTKIGRQVFVRAHLVINSVGDGNTVRIAGLPFTAAAVTCPGTFSIGYFASLAGTKVFITGAVRGNEPRADFFNLTTAASTNTDNAVFGNSTRVDFAGWYQVP